MDDKKVINVVAIMPNIEGSLYIMIEAAKVNVTKKLRGEVTYGQPALFGSVEKAFVGRQSIPLPHAAHTFDESVRNGVIKNNLAGQI